MARLCRFYGGAPGAYLAMPLYQLRVLVDYLPAIEADELRALGMATAMPHMRAEDRRRYIRLLDRLTRPLRPAAPAQTTVTIEHNPQLAAQWFAGQGIVVERRQGDKVTG